MPRKMKASPEKGGVRTQGSQGSCLVKTSLALECYSVDLFILFMYIPCQSK